MIIILLYIISNCRTGINQFVLNDSLWSFKYNGSEVEIDDNKIKHLISSLKELEIDNVSEDFKAYYLFRDQYGGYRIPKEELGEKEEEFRKFIQGKTGKKFIRRLTPLRRLRMWLDDRANEPEHL